MQPQSPSQLKQTSAPNHPPSRGSFLLWVVVLLLLVTFGLNFYASIAGQSLLFSVIAPLLTAVGIIITIIGYKPNIFTQLQQSIKTGLLVFLGFVLIISLGLNGYLGYFYLHPHVIVMGDHHNPSSPSPVLMQHTLVKNRKTVVQVTLPWTVAAKNVFVIAITQWEGKVLSVADNADDAFIQKNTVNTVTNATPSHDYVELYYAKNVRVIATTVTVHFSTAGTAKDPNDENVGIYEYSELDTTNPQVVSMAGYGIHLNGGALHPTTNNELCFVVGVDDIGNNVGLMAGSGYTLEDQQSNSAHEQFYTEDKIVGPGSYQTDFALPAPASWAVIGVLFRPA